MENGAFPAKLLWKEFSTMKICKEGLCFKRANSFYLGKDEIWTPSAVVFIPFLPSRHCYFLEWSTEAPLASVTELVPIANNSEVQSFLFSVMIWCTLSALQHTPTFPCCSLKVRIGGSETAFLLGKLICCSWLLSGRIIEFPK